jgi:phosphodiester glycosidase
MFDLLMMLSRIAGAVTLYLLFGSASIASAAAAQILRSSSALAVSEAGSWKLLQQGIETRKLTLERHEPNQLIELKLLRFDSRRIVPRVLCSRDFQLKAATVKTFAEKSGALAVINANYFDTDGNPLAFLKAANQIVNPRVAKTPLYTGVFAVRDERPFITHRDEFAAEEADEAVQSGPLLIAHGAASEIKGIPSRTHRRAVIGLDDQRRVVVGVADSIFGGLHWPELQELFADARWQIGATDLLNLDGGGSAQLYLKAGKFEDSVVGTSAVPVAIGFFRRDR